MRPYKRIERCIARYIGMRYFRVVEVGVGANYAVAEELLRQRCQVICTDIRPTASPSPELEVHCDDIFRPAEGLYRRADLLYAIRPGVEMVAPLIDLARRIDADLLVYHLGYELYEDGGELIQCGAPLHRYHKRDGKEGTVLQKKAP